MRYTTTGSNDRHLEIINERQQFIGRLDHTSWFPIDKLQITTADNIVYNIDKQGFWRVKMLISRGDVTVAEITYNWRDGFVISFENGRKLVFRRKSIWQVNFSLVDESLQELATIETRFKWRGFMYSYDIDIPDNMLDRKQISYCLLY